MATDANAPYKKAQRYANKSKYIVYTRNKIGKITGTVFMKPAHRPFHISGAGYSLSSGGGGVHVPEHIMEKKRIKRNIVNRIARLSRRANRK